MYWELEPHFWNAVIHALNQSWMLSLARIYENSNQSEGDKVISIYSLVEHQPDAARKAKAKVILADKCGILKNLGVIRGHLLAHNSAEHTLKPRELLERFPLKVGEINSLFETTADIFHLLHPEDEHGLSMEGFNEECSKEAEIVMNKIKYYEDERKKHYEKSNKGETPFSIFPPDRKEGTTS